MFIGCVFPACFLLSFFPFFFPFPKFSEVCSSNKHQLLIELASSIVFCFNGYSLQGSAAYSLHCSAQCSYIACCNPYPFTEAVTFISVKGINRSESRECSAFRGCGIQIKRIARLQCVHAEKSMTQFHWWGGEVLGTGYFYSRYYGRIPRVSCQYSKTYATQRQVSDFYRY